MFVGNANGNENIGAFFPKLGFGTIPIKVNDDIRDPSIES